MAKYYNDKTVIWLDGKLIKASEAGLDLFSQSLHYGYAVFEGIRSYKTTAGKTKIFEADAHYDRLRFSANSLKIPFDYSTEQLKDATYEMLAQNNLQDAYIRPLVFVPANMSFNLNTESHTVIAAWEMAPFLGDKLLRIMTSSFQRPNPKGFIIEAKASGHYVNSILASQEAKANGFDEALLCDMNGFVAEGPGANMFFEKDCVLYTPATGNILPGITRKTILKLASGLNIKVVEKHFTTEELKTADAAFFCGTAAEVIGWESIDDYHFPKPWSETAGRQLQQAYNDLTVQRLKEKILE